jgi:hypothetical protein
MDKAIAKVNQNELDWNDLHLGSDHFSRDVCVNFIKTIFQILRNDVTDNLKKFNLVSKYQMFIKKKPGQVTFFR